MVVVQLKHYTVINHWGPVGSYYADPKRTKLYIHKLEWISKKMQTAELIISYPYAPSP